MLVPVLVIVHLRTQPVIEGGKHAGVVVTRAPFKRPICQKFRLQSRSFERTDEVCAVRFLRVR